MSLLFFDGFETYGLCPPSATASAISAGVSLTAAGYAGTVPTFTTTPNIGHPATAVDANSRHWFTTAGQTTMANFAGNVGDRGSLYKSITTTGNILVAGFKWTCPAHGNGVQSALVTRMIFGTYVLDLEVGLTGILSVYSPVSTPILTTANVKSYSCNTSASVQLGTVQTTYVQGTPSTFEIQIDKSSGAVTVWVNNQFSFTGTLPVAAASDLGSGVQFAEVMPNVGVVTSLRSPIYVTDFYLVDNVGAAPTSRLGKVKVVTRFPAADVTATFTRPSGAASNAAVAAQNPPSATNYLTGVTNGDTDLYSSTAFNFSNEQIIATAIVTSGYKTDVSGNNITPVLQIGSTTYPAATVTLPVAATYSTTQSIFTVNPATGLKFVKADLDAAAFGIRVKDPTA